MELVFWGIMPAIAAAAAIALSVAPGNWSVVLPGWSTPVARPKDSRPSSWLTASTLVSSEHMNRWYFWVIAPVALASAIVIPAGAQPASIWGHVTVWLVVTALLLGTLGLANPRRFQWALRGVAAVIVIAGVAYFGSEFMAWRNGKPLGVSGRRSNTALWNAGMFLLVFGLPALRYLLSGRSGSAVDVIATSPSAKHGESASDQGA